MKRCPLPSTDGGHTQTSETLTLGLDWECTGGAGGALRCPSWPQGPRQRKRGSGRGSAAQHGQRHTTRKAARGSCLSLVYVSREGVNLISVLGSISIRGEYCICIHSPLSPLDDRVPPSVVCFSAQEGLPINSAAAVDNAIVSLRCL